MSGSRNTTRTNQKMRKVALLTVLIMVCLFSQQFPSSADSDLHIYETGTKFSAAVKHWGLSMAGTMEVMENTELDGKNVILVRARVIKMGGLLSLLVKLLRSYKGSNTFDSYMDPDTLMTVRYDMYKLKGDGSKKLNEQLYFDREQNSVISLKDNKTLVSDAPPDVRDIFSIFLDLLSRLNTEDIYVGKKFKTNLYSYKKIAKVEIEVTRFSLVNGKPTYILEIKELLAVFKSPASVVLRVTDVGHGFMSVTEGECTIHLTALPDITLNFKVEMLKRGS